MSKFPAFIGIDWGTSNARFLLIDNEGFVVERRGGAGIGQINGTEAIEQVCFDKIGDWLEQFPNVPVLMAGMVGSNIGWHTTDYVATPANIDGLRDKLHKFQARQTPFFIVPGLSTTRNDHLPDVMRGEEIQIFGAISNEEALVCLPGTHSKWAKVSENSVTGFHTALTGELLDLVGRHSILLNPKRPVAAVADDEFIKGVKIARHDIAGLESLLFTVRSRQISSDLHAEDADNYVAGLAIGSEIKSAMALYGADGSYGSQVKLIGSPELASLYEAALKVFNVKSQTIDGKDASVNGLCRLYKGLT